MSNILKTANSINKYSNVSNDTETYYNNGRLDIMQPNTHDLFLMYDKIPLENKATDYKKSLTGSWSHNNLSLAFFSAENIQILQNSIRSGVYNLSKNRYLIGEQNEDTLKIIMRSIFLQNATNNCNNITQQISELNKIVSDYCVPKLLGEAEGYIKYKNDVSTLAVPMNRPVSTFHNNVLELKKFF